MFQSFITVDSGGPDEGMKPCDRQVGFSEPMERSALYESEAEWEGFEAVTSESESEEVFAYLFLCCHYYNFFITLAAFTAIKMLWNLQFSFVNCCFSTFQLY